MIDRDNVDRFGGGHLQDYVINSNTFGRNFVTNITKDKPDSFPSDKIFNTCLQDLTRTETGST